MRACVCACVRVYDGHMCTQLTAQQKRLIIEFKSITDANDQVAQQYLSMPANGWSVDRAVSYFYDHPPAPPPGPKLDKKKISAIFDKYKGNSQ